MNSKTIWTSDRIKETKKASVTTDASCDFKAGISTIAVVMEYGSNSISCVQQYDFCKSTVVAEAGAFILGLLTAVEGGYNTIECNVDSEQLFLALTAASGGEEKELKTKLKEISKLIKKFHNIRVVLVDRFHVKPAHDLSLQHLQEIRDGI